METIKILLFAANPRGTAPLDLPREFREIEEEVQRGAFRSAVELILVPGTRPVDLLRQLNKNQPQVVHFSSHGNPDEIVLEAGDNVPDRSGIATRSADERDMERVRPDAADQESSSHARPQVVGKSALVSVLRSCDEGNLRLVVLNACHTRSQAEALNEVVDCVVSMDRTISDRAAIKFAASFYGALAFGRSVQRAFDQGVARLDAEGLADEGTPQLLVRAGIDGSRVILVGSAPEKPASRGAETPFIVPFPRNADFVGRDGDLSRLHASLSGSASSPVGIRPAGLTGMGGIGKTQLAVEYVHRHQGNYPDGIFWIDAAGPLADGFARLATDHRLRWAESDRPRDEQIRTAFTGMNDRPAALLVLDNLPDPAALAVSLLPDCVPEDLCCRVLFTTRRHDLGRFAGVAVTILPEEPALRLLLRHASSRAALDPSHPDHEHARAIARMLGRLPLALELAGAYLGKFSGDVSLADYREGLKSDGALVTLDADAAELSEADLRRVHDPAVAAMIREQWDSLEDEAARLLLRVASLFPESSAVPAARLGMLTGLTDQARPGRPSPLRRAVKRLDAACLVELLEGDQVRLHPLIREFAVGQNSPEQLDEFRHGCLQRAAAALEDFPTLEVLDARRGVDGLQEDVFAILELWPPSAPDSGTRVQAVLRLLQREAHHLRVGDQESRPTRFAQQIRNRAARLGISPLQSSAEHRLTALDRPYFRLCWMASRESPALVRTFIGHERPVWTVAISADGRSALSGSGDRTLKLWDLATGQPRLTCKGHKGAVHAAAILPDGRRALSGSHDGTLMLWDLTTGQVLRTIAAHTGAVIAVAVTPDGQRALSASQYGPIKLWDLTTGQVVRTIAAHNSGVSAVAVTPDGRHAVSASYHGTVSLWDLASGEIVRTFAGHGDGVTAVAVAPDGRHAVSASLDRTLKLWELFTSPIVPDTAGHARIVNAVEVTPDGQHAISASSDCTLRLWDLRTGQVVRTLVGHGTSVTAVAVTPDGQHAVSGSSDCTLRLWDLTTGQVVHTYVGHGHAVKFVKVTIDGQHAVSASDDGTVALWALATGEVVRNFVGDGDQVIALTLVVDHRHAVWTFRLRDLATGQPARMLAGHTDKVSAVFVTGDSRYALSGSKDRTLRLWDLTTDQPLITFTGHKRAVRAVALTPDGRYALSGSDDRTLRLWDVGARVCRAMVPLESSPVAIAVAPDGQTIVVGDEVGNVQSFFIYIN